jgi:hypothetical protein
MEEKRYELLSEDDLMQGGDVIVLSDGAEIVVNPRGGWAGEKVSSCYFWQQYTVAVLRPPKGE